MEKDNLRIIVLNSAKELGEKVNEHLIKMNNKWWKIFFY